MESRRELTEARMGLSRFERLAGLQLEVLEQQRGRLVSFTRAGDAVGFARERRKAEATVRQLLGALQALLSLRSALSSPDDQDAFDRDFRPLRLRVEKALPVVSAAIADAPTKDALLSRRDDDEKEEVSAYPAPGSVNMTASRNAEMRDLRDRVLADAEEHKRLAQDIEGIHQIMSDLSTIVHEQQETVDSIEAHVESARDNVGAGRRQLKKAEKYATQSYPLAGAAVGAAVAGGPIGVAAGSIVAAVAAAVTGGVLGAMGGRLWKRKQREGDGE